jgi:hypothetical protein
MWPNTNNAWTCGSYNNRWSGVYGVTVYYQGLSGLSDRDLKQDFGAVPGLNFVNGLLPQSYTFKDDPGTIRWGIVAQDVEELCETQGIANSLVTVGEDGVRNLNYIDFLAPVIKAVQELSVQAAARDTNIADLQARVTALENA